MRSAVFVLAASVLGAASPAPADDANTRKPAKITARSVKPAQLAPGEDRVMRYGLTFRDLDALATLLDGTKARVVPVRHVTRDVTCLDRTARSRLVATVSEFASVEGVEVTKGRFLTEDDNRESQNVVVLGPTIAAALFPSADPIGQTIGCGGHFFKVVGVTRAQKPGAGSAIRQAIEDRSDDVYLPLQTWRARFGTITFIQTDAGRVPESVDLDRIIITLPDPAQAEAVSGKIRKLLEPRHPIDDWAIGSR